MAENNCSRVSIAKIHDYSKQLGQEDSVLFSQNSLTTRRLLSYIDWSENNYGNTQFEFIHNMIYWQTLADVLLDYRFPNKRRIEILKEHKEKQTLLPSLFRQGLYSKYKNVFGYCSRKDFLSAFECGTLNYLSTESENNIKLNNLLPIIAEINNIKIDRTYSFGKTRIEKLFEGKLDLGKMEPKLKSLDILKCFDMSNIAELDISDSHISDISPIASLKNLHCLHISNAPIAAPFEKIAAMKNLNIYILEYTARNANELDGCKIAKNVGIFSVTPHGDLTYEKYLTYRAIEQKNENVILNMSQKVDTYNLLFDAFIRSLQKEQVKNIFDYELSKPNANVFEWQTLYHIFLAQYLLRIDHKDDCLNNVEYYNYLTAHIKTLESHANRWNKNFINYIAKTDEFYFITLIFFISPVFAYSEEICLLICDFVEYNYKTPTLNNSPTSLEEQFISKTNRQTPQFNIIALLKELISWLINTKEFKQIPQKHPDIDKPLNTSEDGFDSLRNKIIFNDEEIEYLIKEFKALHSKGFNSFEYAYLIPKIICSVLKNHGNAEALYRLGETYSQTNPAEAKQYFEKAEAYGHIAAKGKLLSLNEDTRKD